MKVALFKIASVLKDTALKKKYMGLYCREGINTFLMMLSKMFKNTKIDKRFHIFPFQIPVRNLLSVV